MKKLAILLLAWACPVLAQTSGNITSSQSVCIGVSAEHSTVAVQVTGTWTGTLQPQVAVQGQALTNSQVVPSTSTTPASTITANGVYYANVGAVSQFCILGNTVSSGTATIFLNASRGVNASTLSFGGGSIASGTTGQPAVYTSGSAIGAKPWPQGTDITVGAVCDGSTDDSTVLQANMTAAVGTAFVPSGKTCGTTVGLNLPVNVHLWIGAGSSIKATAAISTAVILTPTGSFTGSFSGPLIDFSGGGQIDGNNLAQRCLWIRQFRGVSVHNLTLKSCPANALSLGDENATFNAPTYSSGAYAHDLVIDKATADAGSVGILLKDAGDSEIGPNPEISGYAVGIETWLSQSIILGNHAYPHAGGSMPVCFEDGGTNIWANNVADSCTQYGFYLTTLTNSAASTILSGNEVYANVTTTDNTLIGVFNDTANPTATISSMTFFGQNASHRIATDISATNGLNNVQRSANQDLNVVTINSAGTPSTNTPCGTLDNAICTSTVASGLPSYIAQGSAGNKLTVTGTNWTGYISGLYQIMSGTYTDVITGLGSSTFNYVYVKQDPTGTIAAADFGATILAPVYSYVTPTACTGATAGAPQYWFDLSANVWKVSTAAACSFSVASSPVLFLGVVWITSVPAVSGIAYEPFRLDPYKRYELFGDGFDAQSGQGGTDITKQSQISGTTTLDNWHTYTTFEMNGATIKPNAYSGVGNVSGALIVYSQNPVLIVNSSSLNATGLGRFGGAAATTTPNNGSVGGLGGSGGGGGGASATNLGGVGGSRLVFPSAGGTSGGGTAGAVAGTGGTGTSTPTNTPVFLAPYANCEGAGGGSGGGDGGASSGGLGAEAGGLIVVRAPSVVEDASSTIAANGGVAGAGGGTNGGGGGGAGGGCVLVQGGYYSLAGTFTAAASNGGVKAGGGGNGGNGTAGIVQNIKLW